MKRIILALLMILLVGCTNEEITTVLEKDQSITINTSNNKYEYKNKLVKTITTGDISTKGSGDTTKFHYKTLWGLLGDNTTDIDEKLYTSIEDIKQRGYFVDWKDKKVTISQTKDNEMAALPYKHIDCLEFDLTNLKDREYSVKYINYSTQVMIASENTKIYIDKVLATYQGEFIVIVKEEPNTKTVPSCILVERYIGGKFTIKNDKNIEFYGTY